MNGGANSRPVLKPTRVSPRNNRKQPASHDEEDEDDEAILQGQDDTTMNPDESMAMIDVGGDDDMPINDDDEDIELGEDSRNEDVHQTNGRAPKRATRGSTRLSESLFCDDDSEDDDQVQEPEDEEEADEDEEPEIQPNKESAMMQSKKRGRPAGKGKAATHNEEEDEDEPPRRAPKRRRSNNPVERETSELPVEAKPKKPAGGPRGRSDGAAKQSNGTTTSKPAKASAAASAAQPKPKGKQVRPAKTAAPRSESPAAGADTSLAIVPRGPPLPKSRGLLINRRVEVPGSNDGILRTRSGRNSFRPLAFWRNEHVDYDRDAATDDVFARGTKKTRVLLPTVKEIVRVEQEEAPTKKKSGYKAKTSKSNHKSSSSAFFDPEPADDWEQNPGKIVAETIFWKPEYDEYPPGLEDDVELEDTELAVAGRAIQTREIRNADFRFAKTLSMPFFGAGVVDLPPGAEKRPKNSRKMYMAFFVFAGRVLVTVNGESFRIGRGGTFFVPRG